MVWWHNGALKGSMSDRAMVIGHHEGRAAGLDFQTEQCPDAWGMGDWRPPGGVSPVAKLPWQGGSLKRTKGNHSPSNRTKDALHSKLEKSIV